MAETVEPIVLEILKRIQGDLADVKRDVADFRRETERRFNDVDQRFDTVDRRLDRLEDLSRRHSRDIAGLLFMGKALASQWAEEVGELDKRLSAVEARG